MEGMFTKAKAMEFPRRIVAGHAAGSDMLQGHYVNKEKVVPPMLERVPQPIISDQMEMFKAA